MSLIGKILGGGAKIIDDLHTSKEEKMMIQLEHKKLQTEINRQEAQHRTVFVAGARPFIMWVCGGGLAWSFILHPLLTWVLAVFFPETLPPPMIDTAPLMTLLTGVLGLGAMRSWEKNKKLTK